MVHGLSSAWSPGFRNQRTYNNACMPMWLNFARSQINYLAGTKYGKSYASRNGLSPTMYENLAFLKTGDLYRNTIANESRIFGIAAGYAASSFGLREFFHPDSFLSTTSIEIYAKMGFDLGISYTDPRTQWAGFSQFQSQLDRPIEEKVREFQRELERRIESVNTALAEQECRGPDADNMPREAR